MLLNREEQTVDPRVKRTRRLFRDALLALMAEKTFSAITVQEIAERATVNRVTFYAHFQDKQALLEYSVRAMFREQLNSQLPEDAPYSKANLQLLIEIVCEFVAEMNRHCPPPHGEFAPLMEKQIKAELSDMLQRWLEEMPAGGDQRLAPELGAAINSAAVYAAAVRWSNEGQDKTAREFARQVLPWFLAGLQTSGSRKA
jgi:AcrR family transcriptional regulator